MAKVYLAGPISGVENINDCIEWRKIARDRLEAHNLIAINPLRLDGKVLPVPDTLDNSFASDKGIIARCFFDVKRCDAVFANLKNSFRDDASNVDKPSFGTIAEIQWAYALGKLIVLVSENNGYAQHPFIGQITPYVESNFNDGMNVLIRLLNFNY